MAEFKKPEGLFDKQLGVVTRVNKEFIKILLITFKAEEVKN